MSLISDYEGLVWKIYYCKIEDFEKDLEGFLAFLESLDRQKEEVVAIIPNTGSVKARSLVSSGSTEVKGFAVVVRKLQESPDDIVEGHGEHVIFRRDIPKSYYVKCSRCGKEFTKDFNECPYCGSDAFQPVA